MAHRHESFEDTVSPRYDAIFAGFEHIQLWLQTLDWTGADPAEQAQMHAHLDRLEAWITEFDAWDEATSEQERMGAYGADARNLYDPRAPRSPITRQITEALSQGYQAWAQTKGQDVYILTQYMLQGLFDFVVPTLVDGLDLDERTAQELTRRFAMHVDYVIQERRQGERHG